MTIIWFIMFPNISTTLQKYVSGNTGSNLIKFKFKMSFVSECTPNMYKWRQVKVVEASEGFSTYRLPPFLA